MIDSTNWKSWFVFCVAVFLMATVFSGCLPAIGEMPATGWRVTFGIDPIDGLQDTRRLDQVKPRTQQVKY